MSGVRPCLRSSSRTPSSAERLRRVAPGLGAVLFRFGLCRDRMAQSMVVYFDDHREERRAQ